MLKRFFALSLAALISLSLMGCSKDEPTSPATPATGQVKAGANDDNSAKGPSAPKATDIKFEGVVVALYNGSGWITLNQGSAATVNITMNDTTLQMIVSAPVSVNVGTYTKVKLQISGISSSAWVSATNASGSINFGGAGTVTASVTIEATASIQVNSNAATTIVIDINSNKWLNADGSLKTDAAATIMAGGAFTVSGQ